VPVSVVWVGCSCWWGEGDWHSQGVKYIVGQEPPVGVQVGVLSCFGCSTEGIYWEFCSEFSHVFPAFLDIGTDWVESGFLENVR